MFNTSKDPIIVFHALHTGIVDGIRLAFFFFLCVHALYTYALNFSSKSSKSAAGPVNLSQKSSVLQRINVDDPSTILAPLIFFKK